MTPMNNPMFQLMNVMQNGGNFFPIIGRMSQNNPKMNQAIKLVRGKRGKDLKTACINAYKEAGVDVNQMAGQFGLSLPDEK